MQKVAKAILSSVSATSDSRQSPLHFGIIRVEGTFQVKKSGFPGSGQILSICAFHRSYNDFSFVYEDLKPGPHTCETSALPLSYTPPSTT